MCRQGFAPCEGADARCCALTQGTYLAASVQGDLDAMIEHKEPAAAGAHIRALNQSLRAYWRQVVGSSSGNLGVRARAPLGFWDPAVRIHGAHLGSMQGLGPELRGFQRAHQASMQGLGLVYLVF